MFKSPISAFHVWQEKSRLPFQQMLNGFLLFVVFWMVSAASFSGYATKWGFRDGEERYGIEKILDGTAHKPFIYRQLLPSLANFADDNTPEPVKEFFTGKHNLNKVYARTSMYAKKELRFPYLIIYYCSFLSLLGSAFVLREILKTIGANSTTSIVAPALLVIAFPYLQTGGGYFYDFPELLFLSLAFLCALKGKIFLLLLTLIPATLNKESFLLYLPSLYPILRMHYSVRKSTIALGVAMLFSGILYLLIKNIYIGNPGVSTEPHFLTNLSNYTDSWYYRRSEFTYGLISPSRMSVISLTVLGAIVWRGWATCSTPIQRHVMIAAAINIPFFLGFAATGELRNLSLVFVGMTILLAHALDQSVRSSQVPRQIT